MDQPSGRVHDPLLGRPRLALLPRCVALGLHWALQAKRWQTAALGPQLDRIVSVILSRVCLVAPGRRWCWHQRDEVRLAARFHRGVFAGEHFCARCCWRRELHR